MNSRQVSKWIYGIYIKERFYLKATESRDINDGANAAYNIACDNKVGMIQFEQDENDPRKKKAMAVYLFPVPIPALSYSYEF